MFQTHWGGRVSRGDPSVMIPRVDIQQLPPKRIPQRLSSFPGGFCEYDPIYSCRAFFSWAKLELFLPRNHFCRWWLFNFSLLRATARWNTWTWLGWGVRNWACKGWVPLIPPPTVTGGNEWQQILRANQQRLCVLQPALLPLSLEFTQS